MVAVACLVYDDLEMRSINPQNSHGACFPALARIFTIRSVDIPRVGEYIVWVEGLDFDTCPFWRV